MQWKNFQESWLSHCIFPQFVKRHWTTRVKNRHKWQDYDTRKCGIPLEIKLEEVLTSHGWYMIDSNSSPFSLCHINQRLNRVQVKQKIFSFTYRMHGRWIAQPRIIHFFYITRTGTVQKRFGSCWIIEFYRWCAEYFFAQLERNFLFRLEKWISIQLHKKPSSTVQCSMQ